jgi:peptide/nickel transport system ATP-binding protein
MTKFPILTVNDLHVTIKARSGTVRAVAGISFSITAGETLALVGESGSGKSMTAMSLIGLVPVGTEIETAGRATFLGRELLTMSEKELSAVRGREVGVVFQDPSASLNPLMTVASQILEALPKQVRRSGKGRQRLAELLAEVELGSVPGIARRYPHELSGGQQQRVAIAIALAGNPSLLIADEPTTALDMTVQAQILQLLKHLQESRGMAMLLITHDLGIVANYAQDVLVLRKGEMVEEGSVNDVLAAPRQDYTRMLLDSRPHLHAAANQPATAKAASLLSVGDLVVSYPGMGLLGRPIVAVDGVSFEVPKGTALGIVGESGSGKSTVAKSIVGLSEIRSGAVHFDGKLVADPTQMAPALRARIQYIFQDSYGALNPRMSVEQAVGEPFAITGMPRPQRRAAVLTLLEEVGLSAIHLSRLPRELSGGQRQRVNIARALALSPQLLICDEIASALDVSVQAQVIRLLKELQRKRSLTLVFISHDLAVVAQICDRVIVMQSGKVVEAGPVRTVFDAPAHPYTRRLLDAAAALESTPERPPLTNRAPGVSELIA